MKVIPNLDLLGELESQICEQMSPREVEKFHQDCINRLEESGLGKEELSRVALNRLLEIYNGRPPREEF